MKTLRIALLSLVVAASGAATFAGPGINYWNAHRTSRSTPAPVVSTAKPAPASVDVASEKSGSACDTMIVKHGKRTSTVACVGAITETAKCKAACGS